jgi:hypothetical protein
VGEHKAEYESRGIDRRALIKRAAAAGAVAWTAPVVIGSLSSPAAAITGTPGCFRFQVTPSGAAGTCTTTAEYTATCEPTTTACTPTTAAAGTLLSTWCITTSDCRAQPPAGASVTFTINAGCSCTFLDADAQRSNGGCVVPTSLAAKSVVFPAPGGGPNAYAAWRLIVQCG